MATFTRFEDIEAWKMGRILVNRIYTITNVHVFKSDYILSTQIKRAAISVTSNIAEGFDRDSKKEFIYYLAIAKGSCGEIRSQLYTALDQKYITIETFNEIYNLANDISKLIHNLSVYLKKSDIEGLRHKS